MRWLLNTPILTEYGDYRFSGPLSLETARERAAQGIVSAVGHQGTAKLLSQLLDMEVPVRRETIRMQPGDAALVLRLTQRLPEGVILDPDQLLQWPHEFAWLERRA